MESTSTSAGSRRLQTSAWRSFHRSSPRIASAWVAALAISISGMVDRRLPVGPALFPGAGGGTEPGRPAWPAGDGPADAAPAPPLPPEGRRGPAGPRRLDG